MEANIEVIYASLFNPVDPQATGTGKCSLLDLLNATQISSHRGLSLTEARAAMFDFYSKYRTSYPDVLYCVNIVVEQDNRITCKQVKLSGEFDDVDLIKYVSDGEYLKDVFISSIENGLSGHRFSAYGTVFAPHNIPIKEENEEKKDVIVSLETREQPPLRASTFPGVVKNESVELDIKSEPKSSDSISSSEKKQWIAPKAKQRGLDGMFKRKIKSETPVKTETPVETTAEKKQKSIESKFQFTSRKLIDQRKEIEKHKEQERVKIVQDRLNSMRSRDGSSFTSLPFSLSHVKKELSPDNSLPFSDIEKKLELSSEPSLKKQKIEKSPTSSLASKQAAVKQESCVPEMQDIFHTDSDSEEIAHGEMLSKDLNEIIVTSETKNVPKDEQSVSMTTDSTSFIELVLGKTEKKDSLPQLAEAKSKKTKPALVLESDSQASSDSE
ncbi:hypothetical protein QEN19_003453 [Hanseniaspora menglaensis]